MNKLTRIIAAAGLIWGLTVTAAAQSPLSAGPNPNTNKTNKILGLLPANGFSLLNPDRLYISNSYSFSYLSSGKYSGAFGLYQTSIGYKVSNPLYVQVDLGYLHQPFGFKNNIDVNNRFFPNIHMTFSPSSNFFLSVDYLSGPSNYRNHYFYQEDY